MGRHHRWITTPPTINLTDPATQNAIRQVLDLARDNLLAYAPLAPMEAHIAEAPIRTARLTPLIFEGGSGLRVVPFPVGDTVRATSYSVGAAYISVESVSPEACYRLITALGDRPDLFTGMPARVFYDAYRILLQDPQTVIQPRLGQFESGADTLILPYWMFRAFDRYVLAGADLETELNNAQRIIETYQECVAASNNPRDCADTTDPDFDLFD